jgi:Protein of unknown function (DUF2561)
MASSYSAYRSGSDTIAPHVIDRILLGACAAIWLVLLGVSVAAAVALADLGRGFHKATGNPHTTWVLYAVIAVSALIIAGAIPVLLRARRAADPEPVARTAGRPLLGAGSSTARSAADRARQQQRMQASAPVSGTIPEWSGEAVDRVWLRGTTLLTATMGVALIAVGAATYLMAVGHEGPSWVGYGLAGLVTAAMPVLEWRHVRQLRSVVAAQ